MRRSVSALALFMFDLVYCCRWSTQRANADRFKDHLDGKLTTLIQLNENKQESESGWWQQANYKCGRDFSFLISPRSFKTQHPWKSLFLSIKFVSTSPRVVLIKVHTIWKVRIPNPLATVKSKRTLPTTWLAHFGTYKAKQWSELDPLVDAGAKYVEPMFRMLSLFSPAKVPWFWT